jgi:hypothetical protein
MALSEVAAAAALLFVHCHLLFANISSICLLIINEHSFCSLLVVFVT